MLNANQIATANRVVASIPDLNPIVAKFYDRLFNDYPEVRSFFHRPIEGQIDLLSQTFALAISKLDDIDSLVPVLHEMGARHREYGATPAHYDAVASSFLATMSHELGDKFDVDAHDTFATIFGVLGNVMLAGAE